MRKFRSCTYSRRELCCFPPGADLDVGRRSLHHFHTEPNKYTICILGLLFGGPLYPIGGERFGVFLCTSSTHPNINKIIKNTKKKKSKKLQNFIWNLVEKNRKTKTVGLSMINWRRQRRWNSIRRGFFFVVLFVCLFFLSAPWPAPIPKTQQIVTPTDPGRFESRHQAKRRRKILIYDFFSFNSYEEFVIVSRFSFLSVHLLRQDSFGSILNLKNYRNFGLGLWAFFKEKKWFLNKESTVLLAVWARLVDLRKKNKRTKGSAGSGIYRKWR